MILKPSEKLLEAIRKYQSGDQAAFDTIYYESIKYVTKSVLNVLNRTAPEASDDLQQDIIQDTYLAIASKLDTLKEPEAFLQWAGQIATHHAQRTWNKDVHQHQMEQPEDDTLYELVDEAFIPEDILYNKEKQCMIRQMLDELPTNQYLCVVEYFYNGLKEKEVAEKLGMPVNTVKTNLSRAKKKLKDIVQTTEKKQGIRLYSMSWLLLLLFLDDIKAMAASTVADAVVLSGVHAQIAAGGAAATGTAGAAAGTAAVETAAAAGTAATGAAATAGAGIAAKIGAGILAAVLTVGGAVGGVVLSQHHENETPEETSAIVQTAPELTDEIQSSVNTKPNEEIKETVPETIIVFRQVEETTYDSNGNIVSYRHSIYNENGQQITEYVSYYENGESTSELVFTYDENGYLDRMIQTNDRGEIISWCEYTCSSDGLSVFYQDCDAQGNPLGWSSLTTYLPNKKIASIEYYMDGEPEDCSFSCSYSENGTMERIDYKSGAYIEYEYDEQGRIRCCREYDAGDSVPCRIDTRTYSDDGNSYEKISSENGSIVTVEYDEHGNMIRMEIAGTEWDSSSSYKYVQMEIPYRFATGEDLEKLA